MYYGNLPKEIGSVDIECEEMMLYQYLPIKLKNETYIQIEERLHCFEDIIIKCIKDFTKEYGEEEFLDSYIYLTAKRGISTKENKLNRTGYHTDGFLTKDINYIWSDKQPTVFNYSHFNLSLDDSKSLIEMREQAKEEYEKLILIKCYLD